MYVIKRKTTCRRCHVDSFHELLSVSVFGNALIFYIIKCTHNYRLSLPFYSDCFRVREEEQCRRIKYC